MTRAFCPTLPRSTEAVRESRRRYCLAAVSSTPRRVSRLSVESPRRTSSSRVSSSPWADSAEICSSSRPGLSSMAIWVDSSLDSASEMPAMPSAVMMAMARPKMAGPIVQRRSGFSSLKGGIRAKILASNGLDGRFSPRKLLPFFFPVAATQKELSVEFRSPRAFRRLPAHDGCGVARHGHGPSWLR